MSLWGRAVAVVWDNTPLPLQHLVINLSPRLGRRLDENADRRDQIRARAS